MKRVWKKLSFVLFALLILVLFTHGCAGVRPEIDISAITVADEAAYGKAVNPFVLQRFGAAIPDEEVQGYFAAVAGKLQVAGQGCTFSVVNDPAPTGFALPGCEIVVTRGLLYQVETEAELLAILGHLLGHDRARHGLQLVAVQKNGAGTFESLSDYDAAAASTRFLSESFNAKQEIIADRYAAEVFSTAGLAPGPLLGLLPQIDARLIALPEFLAGTMAKQHPMSSDRIKADERLVAALSPFKSNPDAVESFSFDALRSLLLATRPGYEIYQKALYLEKQGVADQAIGFYLQAASVAPDEALLLTGLGLAYMRQEVFVAARQHLTRAARLNDQYYHPHLGLGYIYLQQKALTRAEKRLRQSQALLPTSLGGYFLGRLYEETADVQSALASYRDVVRYFNGSQMGRLAEKRIQVLESSHGLE